MSGDVIKRIDIKEFREAGFLQEVNRQFFHPLGLALEVVIEETGEERLGGVWDHRDDPEGVFFAGAPDPEMAANIKKLYDSKAAKRIEVEGSVIQEVKGVQDECMEERSDLPKKGIRHLRVVYTGLTVEGHIWSAISDLRWHRFPTFQDIINLERTVLEKEEGLQTASITNIIDLTVGLEAVSGNKEIQDE